MGKMAASGKKNAIKKSPLSGPGTEKTNAAFFSAPFREEKGGPKPRRPAAGAQKRPEDPAGPTGVALAYIKFAKLLIFNQQWQHSLVVAPPVMGNPGPMCDAMQIRRWTPRQAATAKIAKRKEEAEAKANVRKRGLKRKAIASLSSSDEVDLEYT